MLELSHFYASALQKTGEIQYADKAEKIVFNAMQGTRNHNGKGITYCKTDNCSILHKKSPQSAFEEEDGRYKYSPTHADMAVCCNPSYARNLPYFVSNMWMKADGGFAAVLYGPSTLTSSYKGSLIQIEEKTNYPFSDEIEFLFTTDSEIEFKIYLRKPNWTEKLTIEIAHAEINQENGFYVIKKKWKTGDKIKVSFENEIKPVYVNNNEIALQRGALVYALEIPRKEEIIKTYDLEEFTDYMVFPTDSIYRNLSLNGFENKENFGFKYVKDLKSNNSDFWYNGTTYLKGELYDSKSKKNISVKLKPMGSTILRQLTFSVK